MNSARVFSERDLSGRAFAESQPRSLRLAGFGEKGDGNERCLSWAQRKHRQGTGHCVRPWRRAHGKHTQLFGYVFVHFTEGAPEEGLRRWLGVPDCQISDPSTVNLSERVKILSLRMTSSHG
ncbi:hypothetical protein EYF80_045915 [Liparis tanakae]|uniref:Uncharacterized protein n=1 Tax=Liparis tanakae TaxID=230148 RepID=A0A4Z2FT07_9TELE|nr:hypothetical protein EYF80_045915 [Liparis tanakae]